MAASPPVCAATALAADSLKSLRRVTRAMFPPPVVVRGCRACSVAQIARAETLFANQENHGRSAQPRTPGAHRRSTIRRFRPNRSHNQEARVHVNGPSGGIATDIFSM